MAKKTDAKQMVLAFVFAVVLVMGFLITWGINSYYEQNGVSNEIILFETDTNTEYKTYDYVPGANVYFDQQTSQRLGKGTDWIQFNRTPVYTGNSTWSANINNTDSMLPYGWNYFSIQIDLSNVNQWILSKIVANVTLNGDSDLRIISSIDSFNLLSDPSDSTQFNILFIDNLAGGITDYDKSIDIPLSTALSLNNIAQERTNFVLFFNIFDKDQDGFSDWACDWKITLYGSQISGWSQIDSLTVGFGISNVIAGITIIYMTDAIDLGKVVKDVSKYQRKRKTKGGK